VPVGVTAKLEDRETLTATDCPSTDEAGTEPSVITVVALLITWGVPPVLLLKLLSPP
jgi:hypothetical protein